jgi:CHAD domain-containing protein
LAGSLPWRYTKEKYEMDNMQKAQQFVKKLAKLQTANPKKIADKLAMNFSNETLDEFVEKLYSMGWVDNLHKQSRSNSLPDYDRITITEKGLLAAESV